MAVKVGGNPDMQSFWGMSLSPSTCGFKDVTSKVSWTEKQLREASAVLEVCKSGLHSHFTQKNPDHTKWPAGLRQPLPLLLWKVKMNLDQRLLVSFTKWLTDINSIVSQRNLNLVIGLQHFLIFIFASLSLCLSLTLSVSLSLSLWRAGNGVYRAY